jgi:hypothetical protein
VVETNGAAQTFAPLPVATPPSPANPEAQQTITFTTTPPAPGVVGQTYTPAATGGASGNPVTFGIDASSAGSCTISGGVVTFAAVGTCVVDADQAGNADYLTASQVQQSIAVAGTSRGAFIQGNTYSSGSTYISSQTISTTSDVTAGDLIVLAAGWSSQPSDATMTDNQGTTWQEVDAFDPAPLTGYVMGTYWTVATTTGPFSMDAAFSSPVDYVRLLLHEYSGYSSVDVSQNLVYGGSTATGSIITTTNDEMVFAWCVDNNGVDSYTAPMSVRETAGAESTGDDLDAGPAGPVAVTCNTEGGGGGMTIASFKPA